MRNLLAKDMHDNAAKGIQKYMESKRTKGRDDKDGWSEKSAKEVTKLRG